MSRPIADIRIAARASRCHIADLLADQELETLIGTLIVCMQTLNWKLLPPGMPLISNETAAEILQVRRNRILDRTRRVS